MWCGLAQKAVRLGVQQWTEGSEGLRGRKGLVRVKTREWQKDRQLVFCSVKFPRWDNSG